jgi:hypothetical protein
VRMKPPASMWFVAHLPAHRESAGALNPCTVRLDRTAPLPAPHLGRFKQTNKQTNKQTHRSHCPRAGGRGLDCATTHCCAQRQQAGHRTCALQEPLGAVLHHLVRPRPVCIPNPSNPRIAPSLRIRAKAGLARQRGPLCAQVYLRCTLTAMPWPARRSGVRPTLSSHQSTAHHGAEPPAAPPPARGGWHCPRPPRAKVAQHSHSHSRCHEIRIRTSGRGGAPRRVRKEGQIRLSALVPAAAQRCARRCRAAVQCGMPNGRRASAVPQSRNGLDYPRGGGAALRMRCAVLCCAYCR